MKKGLLFLMMFACACSDKGEQGRELGEVPDGTHFSKSFVQAYVIPDKASAQMFGDQHILLTLDGQQWGNVRESEKQEYEALCKKYEDLSFNQKIVPYSTIALGRDYTTIRVVCDKAIDEQHPAGAPLDDMVKLCAVSFGNFIASGYDASWKTPEFPTEMKSLNLYNGIGATPIFKLLSECTTDDLLLVEPEFYLYLTKKPNAGQYEFTITINSAEGNLTSKVKAVI